MATYNGIWIEVKYMKTPKQSDRKVEWLSGLVAIEITVIWR